ncbi:hypothetical protein [Seonamhaeicola aphaedonensis]|uniref:Uncharacterized protein n=1 Tax=Seonamhaeicola aphaedonensis TaxID=1461338 RepID=A0A3D9HKF2_9FLAO|nr:hypothetical protein [Seonamhaeicola aphaedonensis]RED49987.1 hypothetical protein DFQ02_1017 [Seonamhaeicola aphaedonensis]
MKRIKFWLAIIGATLFFNSCSNIVISYNPFYTKDVVYFEPRLIGNWMEPELVNDDEDYEIPRGSWEVQKFKDFLFNYHVNPYVPLEHNKDNFKNIEGLDDVLFRYKKDLEEHEHYKNAYAIIHRKGETSTIFIGTPFNIENQLFIDLMPIYQRDCSNNNYSEDKPDSNLFFKAHIVATHSLIRLKIKSNNMVYLNFIDERQLSDLIDAHKIKISHQKATNAYDYVNATTSFGMGYEDYLLLTARSEELVKFIKKYAKDDDKWIKYSEKEDFWGILHYLYLTRD